MAPVLKGATLGLVLALVPILLNQWHPIWVGLAAVAVITAVFYVVDRVAP